MNQKQFYKSAAWRRARKSFIDYRMAIDGGICEECQDAPGKIVHHWKVWLNDDNCNDPDISLAFWNFKYVCLECHNKEKNPDELPRRRYDIDENGNIVKNRLEERT